MYCEIKGSEAIYKRGGRKVSMEGRGVDGEF